MRDYPTVCSAIDDMIRSATTARPDIELMTVEIHPYRRSTAVRAAAAFMGVSDRDTIVDLSEELSDLIVTDLPSGWAFGDRMEANLVPGGFVLTVDLQPAAKAA